MKKRIFSIVSLGITFALTLTLSLGLGLGMLAATTPEGEGVQKQPPGEAVGREPEIERPGPGLTIYPPDEVSTGSWLLWEFGYLGSGNPEILEPYVDKVTVEEFTINGEPVDNPEQYVVIYFDGQTWFLSFRYQHPPLSSGEYSWSFKSYLTFDPIRPGWDPYVWHRDGEGEFTVAPRGRR